MQLARFCEFDLLPHPDPETTRLSIAKIRGTDWSCVTQTEQWGDVRRGIYISIDALLDPTLPAFEFLKDKATKKFSDGRPAHRLKTIKLRGAISQGLLIPTPAELSEVTSDEVVAALKIERYEPPIPAELSGETVREPSAFAKYTNIENAKNYPSLFNESDSVRVTEKIHGTNFRVGLVYDRESTELVYVVGSHNTTKKADGTTLYATIAQKHFPEAILRDLARLYAPKQNFIIYGEIYGSKVQDLNYGCKQNERQVRLFDVKVDDAFLHYEKLDYVAAELRLDTVPILYRGRYEDGLIHTYRDGQSTLPEATHVREGIVVTAEPEMIVDYHTSGFTGRKILKFISDAYLERADKKDGH